MLKYHPTNNDLVISSGVLNCGVFMENGDGPYPPIDFRNHFLTRLYDITLVFVSICKNWHQQIKKTLKTRKYVCAISGRILSRPCSERGFLRHQLPVARC